MNTEQYKAKKLGVAYCTSQLAKSMRALSENSHKNYIFAAG